MKRTKKSETLRYLTMKKYIKQGMTQQDAYKLVKSTRLADIILNLRREGHEIDTVMVTGKDACGHTEQYARYFYRGRIA